MKMNSSRRPATAVRKNSQKKKIHKSELTIDTHLPKKYKEGSSTGKKEARSQALEWVQKNVREIMESSAGDQPSSNYKTEPPGTVQKQYFDYLSPEKGDDVDIGKSQLTTMLFPVRTSMDSEEIVKAVTPNKKTRKNYKKIKHLLRSQQAREKKVRRVQFKSTRNILVNSHKKEEKKVERESFAVFTKKSTSIPKISDKNRERKFKIQYKRAEVSDKINKEKKLSKEKSPSLINYLYPNASVFDKQGSCSMGLQQNMLRNYKKVKSCSIKSHDFSRLVNNPSIAIVNAKFICSKEGNFPQKGSLASFLLNSQTICNPNKQHKKKIKQRTAQLEEIVFQQLNKQTKNLSSISITPKEKKIVDRTPYSTLARLSQFEELKFNRNKIESMGILINYDCQTNVLVENLYL